MERKFFCIDENEGYAELSSVGRGDPTPPKKPSPFGERVARNAPDEGEMSGSCLLISHLR